MTLGSSSPVSAHNGDISRHRKGWCEHQNFLFSNVTIFFSFHTCSAVFPPLHLHDHDQVRIGTNDHDRHKKFLQCRGKSLELKEGLDRNEGPNKIKNKCQSGSSSTSGTSGAGGSHGKTGDQQTLKTPTKSEQKALHKLEQQQIKSEQKAQQKHEREQLKLEKELLKEQLKLEKEQKSMLKINQKTQDRMRSVDLLSSTNGKDCPQLKTQKSIDLSCLKHQKSVDSSKHPARKSVDMQYKQDLLDPVEFASSFSSIKLKPKK
ncbi:hypothetical protein RUM44_008185 [Polyplax serrata]|uniref:Uncharacterized protein n=1 Tax=Polyplax serrata TaxID=468196 RepID=A0ABR1B7T3_POLSC